MESTQGTKQSDQEATAIHNTRYLKLKVQDVFGEYRLAKPEEVLQAAKTIIAYRFRRGMRISSPDAARQLFRQKLALQEREIFSVLFFDNGMRILAYEELFFGTIDTTSVHPRIIAKRALELNAANVILAHNHPSGRNEPSPADLSITARLKEVLALFDIKILDHFIIGEEEYSMAEHKQI